MKCRLTSNSVNSHLTQFNNIYYLVFKAIDDSERNAKPEPAITEEAPENKNKIDQSENKSASELSEPMNISTEDPTLEHNIMT